MPKTLTVWITRNCGKFLKRWEYQIIWLASWEIYMQVRKQQLEMDIKKKKKKNWTCNNKWSEVTQSCPILWDPINCSPPGSSIHGIFQARILQWVAISFSSRSSWPRDRTQVSHICKQQTGSKYEKEYHKAVYCHPAYLTSMQSTSWEMLGCKKHKLESRLLGEISITSDMQMTPPLWQKVKRS